MIAVVADQQVVKKAGPFHTNICSGRPGLVEMGIAAVSGVEVSLAEAVAGVQSCLLMPTAPFLPS